MNRFTSALLCSCVLLAQPSFCRDTASAPQKDRDFAAFLAAKGDIDAAALEYERLRAENGDSAAIGCAIGKLFLETDPAKAEGYFSEAVESGPDDAAFRTQAENGLILSYLLERKSNLARNELSEAIQKDPHCFTQAGRAFFEGAIDASLYEVDSARAHLSPLLHDPVYALRASRIDSLLSWYRKQPFRHPVNTYVYSTAVPGWGQWYNNDRRGAVAAAGLMTVLTGVLCWEGYRFYRGGTRERYVCGMDMFLVGGLLWRRYHGSIRKAAYNQSLSINAKIQLEFQKRLRSVLYSENE